MCVWEMRIKASCVQKSGDDVVVVFATAAAVRYSNETCTANVSLKMLDSGKRNRERENCRRKISGFDIM